jgi:hypothetical protein
MGPSLLAHAFTRTSHILRTIDFIMPKTWSKPYQLFLRDSSSAWLEAKGKERHSVVEGVAMKIREDIEKDEDDEIEDLEDVSVRCILKVRNGAITLFRKLRTGLRITRAKKGKAAKLGNKAAENKENYSVKCSLSVSHRRSMVSSRPRRTRSVVKVVVVVAGLAIIPLP